MLFLVLFVVPLLELYVLFQVADRVGFWPTVGFTILTAVLGSALARGQAARVWADWSRSLQRLESPATPVLEGLLILVGGVLLLTPGFLTDGFGFGLLIPWTRKLALVPAERAVKRYIDRLTVVRYGSWGDAGAGRRVDVVETTSEPIEEPRLDRPDGSCRGQP